MTDSTCSVDECERESEARGWCRMHYKRWQRNGDPKARQRHPLPDHCRIDGCNKKPHARGVCSGHYNYVAEGRPVPKELNLYGAFWERVERTESGCWHWTGYVHENGYGQCDGPVGAGQAHRVAYEAVNGPVSDDLDIDHTCHNVDPECPGGWDCLHRRCINPDHLEAVTRAENMRRARERTGRYGPEMSP